MEETIRGVYPFLDVNRTPIGIDRLDMLLRGGLLRGRTYLVAGETGTGKTILSLQYLIYGAQVLGENGIYVLVDEGLEEFIRGAKSLGWDLQSLIDEERISIMTLLTEFPERFKDKYLEAVAKSIIKDIKEEADRINAKRLVIDPIAPLILSEKTLNWMREYVRRLMLGIEENVGCTTIVTSEIPTGTNALSRYGVEEFLASGVIVLRIEKRNDEYARVMYIRKMRWTPIRPIELEFDIIPGKGIVIKS